MNNTLRTIRICLLALACGLFLLTPLRAQQATFKGRVLTTGSLPAAGVTVSLHRVTRAGGAETTETQSAADGSFTFRIPPQNPDSDAVFFVAARFKDQLYLGKPFKQPIPGADDYVIQ